ncbi:putative serine/threonine protein kinase [Blattamonas nauphoetae]|uniref:Serine/threonine protein kinase n=1 Tax=Blattamonas nauphoetae TaxID=2049346 RepID=A0ABQ9WSE1_9EUKA|nr:putative serine/threonine protein kinase [Blattamonas nauphoetae]
MADKIKVPEGYSCVRIINSGGFGTVVELIENTTNTHYAGKMVQCLTDKDIARFDREVGRLRRFNHARIVKLKEVVTMDNTKVMVMELGGKSLAEIVKDLTERKVLMAREDVYRVMVDIASALELMHNHADGKTAHGDVKLENILIDADGHAKLCDFGAAESEDVTSTRPSMTQIYVSPERMKSETGKATCASDVWSLGVVLYWLLFGQPAFTAKNPIQLMKDIASFKSSWIGNSCGEEERALLMRMMDTSAASRVTCRQLRLSKSFRCIVNTVEGLWKLNEEEQAKGVVAHKEIVKIKEEKRKAEVRTRKAEREKLAAETRMKKAEEAKEQAERENEKLSDEVKKLQKELEEARGASEKTDETLKAQNDTLKQQLADVPIWVGTDSLQTLDTTAHSLTPTTLTQIVKLEPGPNWKTAFTHPIDEGEWELKITIANNDGNVMPGFVGHPLPKSATQKQCGSNPGAIGGHFNLWKGSMWKGGEFKPAGTNKTCDRIGQTAAIRVNMRTREARLFVDDEEQPGIFTDIPSPLCLGITTGFTVENLSVEVLWLKRRRNSELERVTLEERRTQKLMLEKLKLKLDDLLIWVGTESLQTLDTTAHRLTPTTLTQIIVTPKDKLWRTALTHPIDEGEWELKIRASESTFSNVMLGFLRDPLPEDATQKQCGALKKRFGGDFILWDGSMWKGGEFKPEGTNKKCDQVGQTAAIRVNMRTREARLFVDDEEQPGIFTDIPSPLCLGITTGFQTANLSIEVIWLKRRRNDELERATLEERRTHRLDFEKLKLQLADLPIWVGTESLQTLDTTAHRLTPTTLTQIIVTPKDKLWRTALTHPIDEGEWELKIRASESTFSNVMLGFLRDPLPEDATQKQCGALKKRFGGDFILWDGSMWKGGEFKPEGTNKKCDQVGQTAAIRVNMRTREARLFVDDEEQPGIFTDIPSPLCLGITTGFQTANLSIEVIWLKRRRNDELERATLEERRTHRLDFEKLKLQLADLPIWVGTESLQTLDTTAHRLTPTTLTQIIVTPKDKLWRTALTHPIDEGEWELKIRASESTGNDYISSSIPSISHQYISRFIRFFDAKHFLL